MGSTHHRLLLQGAAVNAFPAAHFRNAATRELPFSIPNPVLDRVLVLNKLKALWQKISHCSSGEDPFTLLLKELSIQIDIEETDLRKIPKTGPVIVIANHPFGILDGLILGSLLCRLRPDTKVLVHSVLHSIPALRDHTFSVNPPNSESLQKANLPGLKAALRWLAKGKLIALFPAGEVSALQIRSFSVEERQWNKRITGMAVRQRAKVVPIFIEGRNSWVFQAAGLLHSSLRTLLLGRELFNKRHKTISVKVGRPISPTHLKRLQSDSDRLQHVYDRLTILRYRRPDLKQLPRSIFPTIASRSTFELENELSNQGLKPIITEGQYEIYLAYACKIPKILIEIGRLREVTFREVGEGTGRLIDLDRFDRYYKHLFIWDRSAKRIAGAYRVGEVGKIFRTLGCAGFYCNTLFEFGSPWWSAIRNGLELGRSFICSEYQRTTGALSLLWRGIGHILAENPHYRYLYGPVSMSNSYSDDSKVLTIEYFKSVQRNSLSRFVAPKNRFAPACESLKFIQRLAKRITGIDDLSGVISDLEPDNRPLPVLFRQYVRFGGEVLSFNVDPLFSNSLDALLLVDLHRPETDPLERYFGRDTMWRVRQHGLQISSVA